MELSQALRERLKERHDSIGLFSRRRMSPLARGGSSGASTRSNSQQHQNTSTSPTRPGPPVSPTFPSTQVSLFDKLQDSNYIDYFNIYLIGGCNDIFIRWWFQLRFKTFITETESRSRIAWTYFTSNFCYIQY